MSAPDRPTREQVETALRRADRYGGGTPPLTTDVLAAEVRALRAELDEQGNELTVRRLQDLVAARTSQGAGEGWDDASDADRRQALRSALRHRDALADELGLEAGMRTAAVDELETLRRRLWELLDDDQLSDDATVDALRAALVARTPRPADEVEQRFAYLANFDPGWDSYGADKIDPAAIATARSVLASLATPVHIGGTVEGGIMLAWDDEHVTVEINPGGKLSASVGELYAEPEAAARTPQPADPADTAQPGDHLGKAWVDAQQTLHQGGCRTVAPGGVWMCTRSGHPNGSQHVSTVGGRVVVAWGLAPLPAVPDGGDVPARLDAAADVLAPFDSSKDSSARQAERHLRRAADWLNATTPAACAAVAAALARPTGDVR